MKKQPDAEVYQLKRETLGELERLSQAALLDLYYGDESGVSWQPAVPYGWQFADEEVAMPSEKGQGINCFGLFTRQQQSWVATTEKAITGAFVREQLERLSWGIKKVTVVVLDNARLHGGKEVSDRLACWQQRGLFVFYLPTYAPHLNLAETVWRKLKYEWLRAEDYGCKQQLHYSVKQALWAFGNSLTIQFSDFNYGLT